LGQEALEIHQQTVRLEVPAVIAMLQEGTLKPASIDVGCINVMRLRGEPTVPTPVAKSVHEGDGFYVNSQLVDVKRRRLWRGCELVFEGSCAEGDLAIFEGGQKWTCEQSSPFDTVRFNLPFEEVSRFALENGRPGFEGFNCKPGTIDYIVRGLALALLPSIEDPAAASPVFLEQVILAMLTHLTQNYAGLYFPPRKAGVLATWQERRAVEFLAAHISTPFSIADLAAECDLSRSYFIKAFGVTFGKTPYRWLMEFRLVRAKEMLKEQYTLADIAAACGFSDQSHFTRAFVGATGTSPGNWRKQSK